MMRRVHLNKCLHAVTVTALACFLFPVATLQLALVYCVFKVVVVFDTVLYFAEISNSLSSCVPILITEEGAPITEQHVSPA